jgi:hypothetical protein
MSVVADGGLRRRAVAWRPGAALWTRLRWAALLALLTLLASAIAATPSLTGSDAEPLPPVGEPAAEAAVLRLSAETTRLIEAILAGDERGAETGRDGLLAELDASARVLRPALGADPGPGRRGGRPPAHGGAGPLAVEQGLAYARAGADYARAGAYSGDVRQLERATELLRLAQRSLTG